MAIRISEPVIDTHFIDDSEVKIILDHRPRDVRGKIGMALHYEYRMRPSTFISELKLIQHRQQRMSE